MKDKIVKLPEILESEFQLILMALGTAIADYVADGNEFLAAKTLMAVNALNKGNPNFKPYRALDELMKMDNLRKGRTQ